jgi:hypothetical protein
MGLTIHYSFKAPASDAQARQLVNALHQTAQDLPFKELGQVVELSTEQCKFNNRSQDDPLRWLLVQAEGSVEYKPKGQNRGQGYTTWFNVPPRRLIGFTAWPGEGCESSNFGLCQYPAVIATCHGPLKTGLSGWNWSSFCKTQYASNPECGGVPHFLQCHLTVIAMLDKAKELGCLERVSDEGGFWEKRDLPALVQEIGSWNEMIAAFGGNLKDLLGDGPVGVQSAIAQYPNFEQLEAAGESKLPPGYEKLARLIDQVGGVQRQRSEAGCAAGSSATGP